MASCARSLQLAKDAKERTHLSRGTDSSAIESAAPPWTTNVHDISMIDLAGGCCVTEACKLRALSPQLDHWQHAVVRAWHQSQQSPG